MLNSYLAMLKRAGLATCVLLAAVSTTAWYLLLRAADPVTDVWAPWPSGWGDLAGWLVVWSTGSVYSALVLFRYLEVGTGAGARAGVLAVAGAISYWIGVNVSTQWSPTDIYVVNFAIAGAITAAGLGYLVIRIGTLRFSLLSFVALCAAGGVGGALIALDDWFKNVGEGMIPEFVVGHATWQILTCISLYFAPATVRATPASSEN